MGALEFGSFALQECKSMKTFLLVAAVIAFSGSPVVAQFTFNSQNRSITATANAAAGTNVTNNSQTLTAPDFSAFNQTVSETASTPTGTAEATSAASASQQSSPFTTSGFFGGGMAMASGSDLFPSSSAEGMGSSSFQVSFNIASPLPLVLSLQLGAHRNQSGFTPIDPMATAMFSFTGNGIDIERATILPSGTQDNTVFYNNTIDVAPGIYVLTLSAMADATGMRTGFLGDLTASATYGFQVGIFVPEPGSLALVASAVVVAIVVCGSRALLRA
jgi:hypothetical protein